jgi:hypothetical protein
MFVTLFRRVGKGLGFLSFVMSCVGRLSRFGRKTFLFLFLQK